jgi:hypothetical protein
MAKDHGNQDSANNMPRWISQKNKIRAKGTVGNANRAAAFGNTTPNIWGVFAVDEKEAAANPQFAHAGIIAKRVGSGGRAGRIQTEVLIAGSTYGKNDFDGAAIADGKVTLDSTRPSNKAVTAPAGTTLSVVPTFRPVSAGATATYLWEQTTNGGTSWTTVTNTGVFSGATTATVTISNTTGMNNYQYRCTVSVVNGVSKVSRVAALAIS